MSKTTWNYRVIKMKDTKLKGLAQTYSWGIYEVYYEGNKPTSWSENPRWPMGDSWHELMADYNFMFKAFVERPLELKNGKLVTIGRFK